MRTETVRLADVYPSKDNPRGFSSKERKEYVDSISEAYRDGITVPPIMVVRDGGIYRIVDGECRYRAMTAAGIVSQDVCVCDDMDEANAMLTMLATDNKDRLTDIERSRGVQQALMLGVEPRKVAKAAKVGVDDLAIVRRVREHLVQDAGDDMTLDRLIWLGSHEDYSKDELDSVANAEEDSWEPISREVVRNHGARLLVDSKIAELEAQGRTCYRGSHELPDGGKGWNYIAWAKEPVCPDCVTIVTADYWDREAQLDVWCRENHPYPGEPDDAERSRRVEEEKRDRERWVWEDARRREWMEKTLKEDPESLEPLMEWSVRESVKAWHPNIDGLKPGEVDAEPFLAVALRYGMETTLTDRHACFKVERANFDPGRTKYIALLEHMRACGYEPSEQEEANVETCRGILARNAAEDAESKQDGTAEDADADDGDEEEYEDDLEELEDEDE